MQRGLLRSVLVPCITYLFCIPLRLRVQHLVFIQLFHAILGKLPICSLSAKSAKPLPVQHFGLPLASQILIHGSAIRHIRLRNI